MVSNSYMRVSSRRGWMWWWFGGFGGNCVGVGCWAFSIVYGGGSIIGGPVMVDTICN